MVSPGFKLCFQSVKTPSEVIEDFTLGIRSDYRPLVDLVKALPLPAPGSLWEPLAFEVHAVKPPPSLLQFYLLGEYNEEPVYAVNSSVEGPVYTNWPRPGYKHRVDYTLGTIDGSLEYCADQRFYAEFLRHQLLSLQEHLLNPNRKQQ